MNKRKVYEGIEAHENPGMYIRFAVQVTLDNCSVKLGNNIPDYFSNALKAHDVTGLKLIDFKGNSANPKKYKVMDIPAN